MKANMLTVIFSCIITLLVSCGSPFEPTPPERQQIVYRVDIKSNIANGTIRAFPDRGVPGTQITLRINPAYGYIFQGMTFGGLANSQLIFDMPANNIIVDAFFEPAPPGISAVHIEDITNGIIIAEPLSGSPGTQVNLRVRSNSGYGLKTGSLTVNGTPIESLAGYDPLMPYTFTLGAQHVRIAADFEQMGDSDLVNLGERALAAGDFDGAEAYFEAAYALNNNNPQAIFYSSLGRLLSIIVSTDMRNLMVGRVGYALWPGSLNSLFSWDWWAYYLENPLDPTADHVLVRRPNMGLPGNFVIEPLYNKVMQGSSLATLLLWEVSCFAQLLRLNPNGWNDLIDDSLRYFLGNEFEAAARRAATLPYGQRITLSEGIIKAVNLEDYMLPGETLGREELDALFGVFRLVKGLTEFLGAFNLETETTFFSWDYTEDLDNFLIDTLPRLGERMAGHEQNPNLLLRVLPFKNFFMRDRRNGRMAGARKNLTEGASAMAAAWNYYQQPGSPVSPGLLAKINEYPWMGEGINMLNSALSSGGTFYFPTEKLEAGDNWVTAADATYGINMDKVFNPGLLALDKLFITGRGNRQPQFYGFTSVNATSGVALVSRDEFVYRYYGLALNAATLNSVFDKGFTQYSNRVWLHDVFSFCAPFSVGREIFDWYQK